MDVLFYCCESEQFIVYHYNKMINIFNRAATETSGTVSSQAKPIVRGERDKPGVIRNAIPNDERVPSSIGRASNPNKAEIPERAVDRNRRGKTQRVCNEHLISPN